MKLSWRERGLVLRDMWNFLLLYKEFKWGRQIAALAGQRLFSAGYSASKAAVISFTKSLAKELAKTGVRVNCVAPAIIATKNLYHDMPEEMQKLWVSRVPMGRPGTPEEVAAMIAWLASEECSFTTGAAFDLSGGRATY